MNAYDEGFYALIAPRRTQIVAVGGDPLVVSSDTVMAAAKQFDSDLHRFNAEVSANPNFGKRLYLKADAATKAAHDAFVTTLSAVNHDWWGESDGRDGFWEEAADKGRKDAGPTWQSKTIHPDGDVLERVYTAEQLGYDEALRIKAERTFSSIGASELAVVRNFRERLMQAMRDYKALGYDLHTQLSPEIQTPTSMLEAVAKGVVAVAAAGTFVYAAKVIIEVLRHVPARTERTPVLPPEPAHTPAHAHGGA